MQHAKGNMQRASTKMQHETCNAQRATSSKRRVRVNAFCLPQVELQLLHELLLPAQLRRRGRTCAGRPRRCCCSVVVGFALAQSRRGCGRAQSRSRCRRGEPSPCGSGDLSHRCRSGPGQPPAPMQTSNGWLMGGKNRRRKSRERPAGALGVAPFFLG